MNKEIETNMIYKDMPVVISQGIGDREYFVMAIKPNGSRKRILKKIEGNLDPMFVLNRLQGYKTSNDWNLVPEPLINDHSKKLKKWAAKKAGSGTHGTKCLKPKA